MNQIVFEILPINFLERTVFHFANTFFIDTFFIYLSVFSINNIAVLYIYVPLMMFSSCFLELFKVLSSPT